MNNEDKTNRGPYLVDLIDKLAKQKTHKEKSKILEKPLPPRYWKR